MNQRLPSEFVTMVNDILKKSHRMDLGSVHIELSSILPRLFSIAPPELLPCCEAFDRVAPNCPIFLVAQSIAKHQYRMMSPRMKLSSLSALFYLEIPSQKLRLLKALQTLLDSGQHSQSFQSLLPHLFNMMNVDLNKPLLDSAFCGLVASMVGSSNLCSMKTFFLQDALDVIKSGVIRDLSHRLFNSIA
jgi:hypothetical protein